MDDLTWNYPKKHFFLPATIAMVTVKCLLPIFIAAVFGETYSFIKIMQLVSPNYELAQTIIDNQTELESDI